VELRSLLLCFSSPLLSLDGVLDLGLQRIVFPVSLLPEVVVDLRELLEEAEVGLNLSAVPHVHQRLCSSVVLLQHEVGSYNSGSAGISHEAVDEDQSAAHRQGPFNEVCTFLEMLFDVSTGHILDNEPLVANSILRELGRIHPDINLSCVQYMGHPKVKQVVNIFDGLPAADDDAREDLVTVLLDPDPLSVVQFPGYSWHKTR